MGAQEQFADGINATDEIIGVPISRGLGDTLAILAGDRQLTYNQLDALTNQFGNALRECGVEPENRVLFLMNDTPELVAGYLGAMRIGAVSVAFNIRASADDLLWVIEDSRCKVLFIDGEFLHLYRTIAERVNRPLKVVVHGAASGEFSSAVQFADSQSDTLASTMMSPDDMAYWIYTSGTTGHPKGAVHRQASVLVPDLHLTQSLGVKPGDRLFSSSKIFFAYALGHILMGGLRAGATIILYDGWPDAQMVTQVVERHQPDLVFSVPTFYRNLLRDGAALRPQFKRVRHFISAGEKLPESLWHKWFEATGVAILEGIGSSESGFLFIANTAQDHKPGASGRPLPWSEVKLLDDDGNRVVKPGQPGVAWVRMDSVFERYWNRRDKTRETLSGDWYRTGDVFTFDEAGWYYHGGRDDDMLKISGQWVSPEEIEACVLKVPLVSDAVAVGIANADQLIRINLFVVTENGEVDQVALAKTIQDVAKQNLSIYKCPRNIHFVDEIPRTATGKAQRYRLRQRLEKAEA